jgi:hypothetical protein
MKLDEHLANAIQTEGNVLQFTLPDTKEQAEKLVATHHRAIADKTAAISRAKQSLRRTIAGLDAEIERLQKERRLAQESADEVILYDRKIIEASKAFIAILEAE